MFVELILYVCFPSVIAASFATILVRNQLVSVERKRIIDSIRKLNTEDIKNHNFDRVEHRWSVYESGPSYDEMLRKFWKPVKSFFPPVETWVAADSIEQ